ncbi:MAG TPA: hypothetical protein VME63_12140 [Dyella sp.]|uniref:hypothetical protein n=1 Tax=Dyella sp. TaxID=1869338 RepID=UPI002C2FC456|nr:hypothetical protein [Dyella sp.]HTV86154.1 hypothetical protein [Dyella sp.]
MNISSVGSSLSTQTTGKPESAEVPGAPDHDGDADDSSKKASSTPATVQPQSTVNSSGQRLGQLINASA